MLGLIYARVCIERKLVRVMMAVDGQEGQSIGARVLGEWQ